MLYEQEKLFDRYDNYRQYHKLDHPRLAEQLRLYICDSGKQPLAREAAIDIAEVCKVSELQEELVNLAIDPSQLIYLRASAAKALCKIGDMDARSKLKILAINPLSEDENDEIKGYALQALWPDYLTAEELFQALTRPKKCNFSGIYRFFLYSNIVPALQINDLVVALNWLEKQGVRCLRHPFEKLGDEILMKAWENLDSLGVAEAFTKVALVQWREYQEIITSDNQTQGKLNSSISQDIHKRHILIEQGVVQISKIPEKPYLLYSFTENIVTSEDIPWMIECLKTSDDEREQKTWSILVLQTFKNPELMPREAKIILESVTSNSLLREQFLYWIQTIDLDSVEAVKMFTEYLRSQVSRNYKRYDYTLTPTPQERVLRCLEKLENGDLDAWWQLSMEMTLTPIDRFYPNEFELDLTKLPGWREAEEVTRSRILEGARNYIQLQNKINYQWIGTNTYDQPALAGGKAFYLLLKEVPKSLEDFSFDIWKKWASVIIAIPSNNHQNDHYLELVKLAYEKAPEESIDTLIMLIDQENQTHDYIYIINHFDKCWDERLKSVLLDKAKDPIMKPKCIENILDSFLQRGFSQARDFAKSLITFPIPQSESDRKKVIVATKILIQHSDSSDWPLVWSLIQKDRSFGCEVFELTAYRYSHGLQLNVTETQLADLYIWLVNQYPHHEDPDYSNEAMAHCVGTREAVGNFRDNVLTQLRERSNDRACTEIDRIIQELPHLPWLKQILADTKTNARRQNWQPLTPEELLRIVPSQRTSHLDKIDRIDRRTQKMAEEPKIDRSVHLNNSPVGGSINTGDGNIETKSESPSTEKRFDWKFWLSSILLPLIIGGISIAASGVFNDEIKNFIKRDTPAQIEPKLDKNTR